MQAIDRLGSSVAPKRLPSLSVAVARTPAHATKTCEQSTILGMLNSSEPLYAGIVWGPLLNPMPVQGIRRTRAAYTFPWIGGWLPDRFSLPRCPAAGVVHINDFLSVVRYSEQRPRPGISRRSADTGVNRIAGQHLGMRNFRDGERKQHCHEAARHGRTQPSQCPHMLCPSLGVAAQPTCARFATGISLGWPWRIS